MRTYKKVGTDPQLLACYSVYQRFCSTLKLDWLLQLELLAFSLLGLQELTWQWYLAVGVQLPIALLWLPLGLRAARRESPMIMALLIACAAVQPFVYATQLLTLHPHNGTTPSADLLPDQALPPADADADAAVEGAGGANRLVALWAGSAGDENGRLSFVADGTAFASLGSLAPAPNASRMYCTQRLRERTFPFASAPLNIVYLFAVLIRLIFLGVAMRVRLNFGKGLAAVLRGQRGSDGSRAAGSGFSSGVLDPVLPHDPSVGSVAAAAEYLLPRPVADEGGGSACGVLPDDAEPGAPFAPVGSGGSIGRVGAEAIGDGIGGRGQSTGESASTEPQQHEVLSRAESTESSSTIGPPLQRLTIGDGSLSTLGPGSMPGSFVSANG